MENSSLVRDFEVGKCRTLVTPRWNDRANATGTQIDVVRSNSTTRRILSALQP